MTDFFISRAGEDRDIALRINDILRSKGYTIFSQDRDFGHSDFTERMDEGFRRIDNGARLIALLSKHYVQKSHCMKEARYPLTDDPSNTTQKLIAFRIDDVKPDF